MIPQLMPSHLFMTLRAPVIPGSTSYTTPGTYSWTVPDYDTLLVDVLGGGQGGQGGQGSWAMDENGLPWEGQYGWGQYAGIGGHSAFADRVVAGGGGNPAGWGGSITYEGGYGGAGGQGGAGGFINHGSWSSLHQYGVNGAAGATAQRTFMSWLRGDAGAPTPGSMVSIVVGGGSAGGAGGISYALGNNGGNGYPGGNGSVWISWS